MIVKTRQIGIDYDSYRTGYKYDLFYIHDGNKSLLKSFNSQDAIDAVKDDEILEWIKIKSECFGIEQMYFRNAIKKWF